MAKQDFKDPGVFTADYETVKSVQLATLPVGKLDTLKDFQDKNQHIFFTPAIPYAWAYEQRINFDPLFSDIPEKYRKQIKQLSLLPADIVDGFYGNQAYWNRTLWTIPAEQWLAFCKHIGGKGFVDTDQKLVVFFSMGLCNAEDVLAKVKGKQPDWIQVAHIDVHTNLYSLVMTESINTTALSVVSLQPDPQIVNFASKFLKEDSDVVKLLPKEGKRKEAIIAPVEKATIDELTPAQRKRYIELRTYYKQIFDNRVSQPES